MKKQVTRSVSGLASPGGSHETGKKNSTDTVKMVTGYKLTDIMTIGKI